MGEPQLETSGRSQEESEESNEVVSDPTGSVHAHQPLEFACSGNTFKKAFCHPEDAINLLSALPSGGLPSGGKGTMAFAALSALKRFPSIFHQIQQTLRGWRVLLFRKEPGDVRGPMIGSVHLEHGMSKGDQVKRIQSELQRVNELKVADKKDALDPQKIAERAKAQEAQQAQRAQEEQERAAKEAKKAQWLREHPDAEQVAAERKAARLARKAKQGAALGDLHE